jgi:hypothetical protein
MYLIPDYKKSDQRSPSPHLNVVLDHSKQMDRVEQGQLVEFPRDPEILLHFSLCQVFQHPPVD